MATCVTEWKDARRGGGEGVVGRQSPCLCQVQLWNHDWWWLQADRDALALAQLTPHTWKSAGRTWIGYTCQLFSFLSDTSQSCLCSCPERCKYIFIALCTDLRWMSHVLCLLLASVSWQWQKRCVLSSATDDALVPTSATAVIGSVQVAATDQRTQTAL